MDYRWKIQRVVSQIHLLQSTSLSLQLPLVEPQKSQLSRHHSIFKKPNKLINIDDRKDRIVDGEGEGEWNHEQL